MPGGRPLLCVFVLVALLAPTAAAFAAAEGALYLSYDAAAPPALLATGAVESRGSVVDGMVIAGSTTTRLQAIPHLTIVDRTGGTGETQVRDATIEVHAGALLWGMPPGTSLGIALSAPYALGLGLPQAPLPSGTAGAGFLISGEAVTGSGSWTRGTAELAPFDAAITIRDARGTPLAGWESRRVNAGATSQSDPDALGVVFRAEGAFEARIGATLLGGAVGRPGDLTLSVSAAGEDRLAATAAMLEVTTAAFFGGEDPFSKVAEPLDVLAQASGILNGAVLVLPGGVGEGVDAIAPIEARHGDAAFDPGALTILRGDMDVVWQNGEMQVQGEPTVALGRNGFQIDEPLRVWIFPFVSLVLWALAAGAITYYFMKRPPQGAPSTSLRLLSFGFYVVMIVAVFFVWDRSFEQSFGTGVFSTIRSQGITPDSLPTIGLLLGLELVPWGIAALLFALPVRIALGVALRYLGRGKSFKGLAAGGGMLSLGLLGPVYALWCFNLVWARAGAAIGT